MEHQINDSHIFVVGFIVLMILLIVATVSQPASAYTYIQQGENVSLGDTVDLTGVYGWTGILGWWKNTYYEGGKTDPDIIIDLNDYRNIAGVYLDPTVWKLGNWYQWDGKGKETHGNTFVFKVNPQTYRTEPTNFTTTGKTSTPVKVNVSKTPELTIPPTLQPIQTPIPTPGPTLVVIPMRTLPPPRGLPIEPGIVAIAVIGGSLLFLWFRTKGNT
jgi:hypothetical protein